MAAIVSTHKFIDIGVNLTDGMFRGLYNGRREHIDDFDKVLKRAFDVGVSRMLVTASYLDDARDALAMVKKNDALFTTVGVHPTRCGQFERNGNGEQYMQNLRKLIEENRDKVVAVGECGLDYDRLHFCDRPTQLKWFERQFELAESSRLPMFLHSRNTGNDFLEIVQRNRSRFTNGVVHSFTGTWEEAEQLLNLGLYIGINGCSLKTADNLRVLAKIPLHRLMLETDGPWCSIKPTHASYKFVRTHFPSRKRDRFEEGFAVKDRCEPCHIQQVLEVTAAVHGVSETELAQIVHDTTMRVFFPNDTTSTR